MKSDCPAALPLIAYISGLLFASSARDAFGVFVVACLLLVLGFVPHTRLAITCLMFAAGILASLRQPLAVETQSDRFVTITAAIDRDWIDRDSYHALRVRYRDESLTIVTRFPPRAIGMEESVVAEGFLRRNERDELTLMVKSPRLMRYEGRARPWLPGTWNRALANRLRPFAKRYPTEVALVNALALGRGERLAEDVRDSYKRAGTYHLLVFSGLQIAFAAAAIAALLRWLHAPRASDWSLLVFAAGAPLFIGASASVVRASIAIGVYAISRLMHRPTTFENLWCVAALIRLVVAPQELSDAAFQLTYGGAAALLFVAKPWRTGRLPVYAAAVEWVVTPMTLYHFHQYSLGGSLATLLLSPLVSALLLLSAATCAFPCDGLLRSVGAMHWIAMRVNAIGVHGSGAFAAPLPLAYGAATLGALLAIGMFRGRKRSLALLACMSIASASAIVVSRRDVARPTITVLDVGQGDAILLRTPRHAMLIDGGPSPSRLLPLLADRGVRHLDAVLLTHAHPDHCGGLPAVLSRMRVDSLWISPRRFEGDCARELLDGLEDVPIHLVRDGDRIAFGGVSIRAFTADRTFRRAPENNSSVILRVTIGSRVALLTGDIERDAESAVAARLGRVDILKVAHHGSRTSSTLPLLDAIAPRVAVISCGRHNLFGHPHAEVVQRLHDRDIRTFRTDRNGDIDIECDGPHIFVRKKIDTP